MNKSLMAAFAAALVVLTQVDCNKRNSVTGSSPTPGAATTYLSGYDGSPVSPQVSGSADQVTVSMTGFLTLDTVDRHRPVYLWPNDSRMTVNDTFLYVYGSNEFNPLARVGDSAAVISVILHGDMAADSRIVDAVNEGVAKDNVLAASAGLGVRFMVGGGGLKVDVYLDPNDPLFANVSNAGAGTYNTDQRNIRVSSRIVVGSVGQARMPITWQHELVHVLGLGHSVHAGPMMNSAELYHHQEFTDLDVTYARMLFQRQPGTKLSFAEQKENDRVAVQASAASATTTVVSCSFQ